MSPEQHHEFVLEDYAMHHVLNGREWHLPFLPPIHLPPFLSLHGLMVLLCAAFLIIIFCISYNKKARVPHGLTNFLEMVVVFIRDEIAVAMLGPEEGIRMTPLFCTFFFFILGMNLTGLILPIFSTATANVNVTGALACVTLGFMVFGTIYKNGWNGFVHALVPQGVPWPLLLLLVPLEFLGLFIKAFALMIRLFANMLAGHIAIFSLIGLVGLFGYVALPAIAMAVFVSLLEIFIAFLQAYIFTMLSAMFMGLMYHPEH